MADQLVFLITGTRGALAKRLLALLREEVPSARIIAVARQAEAEHSPPTVPGVESLPGDLREAGTWERLPATITHVFHLAAVIPWNCTQRSHPSVLSDNLLPIARLLERVPTWPGLKQVIFSSSVSVYQPGPAPITEAAPPRPQGLYGMTKLAGEGLLATLRSTGVAVSCLRYTSLYGPGQYPGTVLPAMVRDALKQRQIHVFGAGRRTQDFLHHADAARAALLAFRHRADGIYNVASGRSTSMAELAGLVRDVFTAGKAEILLHPDQPEGAGYAVDISRAARELGFRLAVDLREGLIRLSREIESVPS